MVAVKIWFMFQLFDTLFQEIPLVFGGIKTKTVVTETTDGEFGDVGVKFAGNADRLAVAALENFSSASSGVD